MTPTYGLVICGGKSTRMGTDKGLLNYHGKPQRYHLHDILSELCEKVFISCNANQAKDIPDNYAVIVDAPEYRDIGPMGALLSAYKKYPNVNFLVIGCDYPLIEKGHLQALLEQSHQSIFATCCYNSKGNIYEPLIAHYQSEIQDILQYHFKQKSYSLQKVLKEAKADIMVPENELVLKSIDTPDEYENILKQL